MAGERFHYQPTKAGAVRVFWDGRCVRTVGGERGRALGAALATASDAAVQHLLRRATGNFKRGNERSRRP